MPNGIRKPKGLRPKAMSPTPMNTPATPGSMPKGGMPFSKGGMVKRKKK